MRYVLTIAVLFMLAGCAEYEPAVWIGGGPSEIAANDSDQSIGMRAGLKGEAFEVGVSSSWYVSSSSDAPQTFGLYGLYHLPDPIDVGGIESRVYAGAQIGLPELDGDHNDGGITRGICGVLLPYNAYIEYNYDMYSGDVAAALNDHTESKVSAGWRIAIK